MQTQGKLVVVSAPSGAGKTTLVRHLLTNLPGLAFSVSATSRKQRPGEQDGVDYYFLSPETFRQKVQEQQFLEWEEVYPGIFYGTLKSEVERLINQGKHVVFDVDVVGGLNIKRHFGDKALSIFVMPPSVEALANRLRARSTETEESLFQRISKANQELRFAGQFDKILLNDDLNIAQNELLSLVKAFLSV